MQTLSAEQIRRTHTASLRILEETGVSLTEPEARELLHGAGAQIVDDELVRIPAHLVEEALESAPSEIRFSTRAGEDGVVLGGYRSSFGLAADAPDFLDPQTGDRRPCVASDAAAMATLCDALPDMDFLEMAGHAADVPAQVADRVVFRRVISHTEKLVGIGSAGTGEQALLEVLEMAALVAGGKDALRQRPFIWYYAEPISPLIHVPEAVRKLLICADWALPVVYIPMPQLGSSAPITLAAALAQGNAETLSGLVIHQLKRPGAPFIYGAIPGAMDMKTTVVGYGSPEMSLVSAAYSDLAHHYGLPMFGTGGCGDAKALNLQIAAEATLSLVLGSLSGANLVHDIGLLDQSLVVSPELTVLVHEVIGMVKRILGGVPTEEGDFALDLINEVGPGGEYLTHNHTFEHFRDVWYPTLFDRTRSQLDESGESLNQRLRRQTLDLLEEHEPNLLPEEVEAELDRREAHWLSSATS
jgi:trimethylamine--corrinoid protein Co-methyltransferase